jgi:hypothetical protein
LGDAGEEAVKTKGVFAGFGDDGFIASKKLDVVRVQEMVLEEEPEELRPWNDGGEEALNGAIAGTSVSPAGDASHRDTTSHGQHGENDLDEGAKCRWCQRHVEAPQGCYNIHGLWLS